MTGAPETRPDVLLVVSDDLGYGDLSCYGARAFATPAIDALAVRGRRCTDAHAASAVCTPSRYALLTGRYPWRTPLRSRVLGGTDGALIDEATPTLAGVLHDAGYRTAAIGKWHLGLDWKLRDGTRRHIEPDVDFSPAMEADGWDVDYEAEFENGPLERGFDEFFGISGSLDMPPYCFLRGRRAETVPTEDKTDLVTSQRPGPAAPNWRDGQVDLRFAAEAEEWLERTAPTAPDDPPRFLYVATAAPHRPCVPPAPFAGATGIGPRADSVLLVDAILERLVASLGRSGRPTLVLFTSDNGAPTCYPEDGLASDHAANGPWRGQKADVYDGGHRIPLIMAGHGVAPGTDDRLLSLLDVLPSLAQHVGAPVPPTDGSPLLLGDVAEPAPERVLGATAFDGSMVLMRHGDTAVFSTGSGGFSDPVGHPTSLRGDVGQFYDRQADPGQRNDLWDSAADARCALVTDFVRTTDDGDPR